MGGTAGEREDVVHDRRLGEQAGDRRQRRLGPDHPPAPLEALEHGGLLAADVRPGPDAQVELEGATAPEYGGAEPSVEVGDIDRRGHRGDGVGVLRADVDVALGGADREAGDHHPLDQQERVALHEHAVGECATVALVRVAGDELEIRRCVEDRLPLDAGRETRAAPSTQPGVGHFGHDLFGGHLKGTAQSGETSRRLVVRHGQRIVDPDPGEGEASLAT